MRHIARFAVLLALIAALAPLSASAQVAPAVPVVTVPTTGEATTAPTIDETLHGAIADAYANLANARAQLTTDPMNAHFQDEVASAQAAYDEVVAAAGIEVVAPAEVPPAETMSPNPDQWPTIPFESPPDQYPSPGE
jgi:hypothetical protein